MEGDASLVGREKQLSALRARIADAHGGNGGLLLVAGEAGVGKTALVEASLTRAEAPVLRAQAREHAPAPYEPLISLLRAHERREPGALLASGTLAPHLAALLPELGPPPPESDRVALADALRDGLAAIARDQPTVLLLDDVQWCDEATLDLLPSIAAGLRGSPLLLIAVYRSGELPRAHPLRALRGELRRSRSLEELVVEPLSAAQTAELAGRVLSRTPGPRLAQVLFERTQGVPFFVEELAAALSVSGRLLESGDVAELLGRSVPLPETVRDAVRVRTDRLSVEARRALEVAAMAGARMKLSQVATVAGEAGLDELMELSVLVEDGDGEARFRHALVRDALHADIPWTRRRAGHRRFAELLEGGGASSELVAEHWLEAGEPYRARPILLAAAHASAAVHAYRDAARLGWRALDSWARGDDEPDRLAALEHLGRWAELCGELGEAGRAWEEVRDVHAAASDAEALAEIARRLAGVYELQGMPDRAGAAREHAAASFEAVGRVQDAATERLAIAERLELAGHGRDAVSLLESLSGVVSESGPVDLRVRAMALEGELRAKQGQAEAGLTLVRDALAIALEHGQMAAAADAYYRLGAALENSSDHPGAVDAYTTARGFCSERGIDDLAQICFACMLPALLLTGQWKRTTEVARDILGDPGSPPVARAKATGHLGIVRVLRGDGGRARRGLEEAVAFGRQQEIFPIEVYSLWGLARALELGGAGDLAADRCRELLDRSIARDELHYCVPPLRWASTFFARRGQPDQVAACADHLARVAAATGHPECLGPLAHALGEVALLEHDAAVAVTQFNQASELMAEAGIPYERAETQLRAGVALIAVGRREEAAQRLTGVYRTARKLGARPLAVQAAAEMRSLGEPVDRRLGRRAAAQLDSAGLSPRELEVLRLAATGLTNREIAVELFLSKRTVDMHVRNMLAKLGCRSRIEAATRARSLALIP